MVLWPIIHGALIMIGPLILCAFITTKFQPQIKTLVGNNVDIADVQYVVFYEKPLKKFFRILNYL